MKLVQWQCDQRPNGLFNFGNLGTPNNENWPKIIIFGQSKLKIVPNTIIQTVNILSQTLQNFAKSGHTVHLLHFTRHREG